MSIVVTQKLILREGRKRCVLDVRNGDQADAGNRRFLNFSESPLMTIYNYTTTPGGDTTFF